MRGRRYALRTPLGPMVCEWTERGLARFSFATGGVVRTPSKSRPARLTPKLETLADQEGAPGRAFLRELDEYFGTGRTVFRTRLDLLAGSEFQRAAWLALRRIPPGSIRTYGEVAREIGRPGAARAVGNACGSNPVVILVPCHRVVATDGIGGFGAGLDRKRRLLGLEGVRA